MPIISHQINSFKISQSSTDRTTRVENICCFMEGPSVHRVAEELSNFEGQTVKSATGNAKQPLQKLEDKRIEEIRAIKKRLFLDFASLHIVIHFLMYGSYRVNEERDLDERLSLVCEEDTLNIYSCSVKVLEEGDEELSEYDRPREDVLSEMFDIDQAVKTIMSRDDLIADILLDQNVFGGVGNIIKNEVLWEAGVNPNTIGSNLMEEDSQELAEEAVQWSKYWYETKKNNGNLDMSIYRASNCPNCGSEVIREEIGENNRITYWCPECQ